MCSKKGRQLVTDYRDRQIELFLREELGGEQPPDQTQAILDAARQATESKSANLLPLEIDTPGLNAEEDKKSLAGRKNFLFASETTRLWVGLSIAALLLVAIAAGVIYQRQKVDSGNQIADTGSDHSDLRQVSLVNRDGMIMPESTDTVNEFGQPILREGWVLTQPGSPAIWVGLSQLRFNNARAVVRVGQVPDSYEVALLARRLLETNYLFSEEEFEMLINSKGWVAMMGFAVCVLSGDALVGQETLTANRVATEITVDDVFDRFDLDESGKIELDECVCDCSKQCDLNSDKVVTRKEFHHAVAKFAGSGSRFVHMVAEHGGVDAFYELASSGKLDHIVEVSMKSVFDFLDTNGNGVLEQSECICRGSKMADANQDGEVTREEMARVAVAHFGSEDGFLVAVREAGGVANFFQQAKLDNEKSSITFDDVFEEFDRDGSGTLERAEMIFPNGMQADQNGDGLVSAKELKGLAEKLFGTVEKFEAHVNEFESAAAFYEAVKNH